MKDIEQKCSEDGHSEDRKRRLEPVVIEVVQPLVSDDDVNCEEQPCKKEDLKT